MSHRTIPTLVVSLLLVAMPAKGASNSLGGLHSLLRQSRFDSQAGHFDAALVPMLQAVKLASSDFDVQMALGKLRDARGEYAEGLKTYETCLALKPDDFDTQVMIAHSYMMLGEYDRARKLCETLEHHPGRQEAPAWYRSEVYTTLGGAEGFQAQHDGFWAMLKYGLRVRGELDKALKLDPENPRAQYGLGRYFLDAPGPIGGDASRGARLLAKAARMDEEDFVIRGWFVRSLFRTHQPTAQAEALRFVHDFAKLPTAQKMFPDLIAKAHQ